MTKTVRAAQNSNYKFQLLFTLSFILETEITLTLYHLLWLNQSNEDQQVDLQILFKLFCALELPYTFNKCIHHNHAHLDHNKQFSWLRT
jgi:hypothetical protein